MAGNPIEVAAVIAWRVNDTAKASFEVEDYANFLAIQGESAIRAVIAARRLIVEGAVGMVKMALDKLQSDGVVTLSDADRVRLATNLLTVLVSETETQPVLAMSR